MRIPEEEQRQLQGSEEVAKPGDVVPEVAYGNATATSARRARDVGTDQPVPLDIAARSAVLPKQERRNDFLQR